MTKPADRAAANRTRRLKKQVDARWARLQAADPEYYRQWSSPEAYVAATLDRLADGDPAYLLTVGRALSRALLTSAHRADVGRIGGYAARRKLTRQQLSERGRPGGLKVFYSTPEDRQARDPAAPPLGTEAHATAYSAELNARRALKRRSRRR